MSDDTPLTAAMDERTALGYRAWFSYTLSITNRVPDDALAVWWALADRDRAAWSTAADVIVNGGESYRRALEARLAEAQSIALVAGRRGPYTLKEILRRRIAELRAQIAEQGGDAAEATEAMRDPLQGA